MNKRKTMKFAGILWLFAAGMFMLAGAIGGQVVFYGVGASFIGIGVVFIVKSQKEM